MKRSEGLKGAVLALALLALVSLYGQAALALGSSYTLSADYIMFDIDKKIAYADGHSEFLFKKMRFQAESIRVDIKTNVLYAEGNVVMTTMAVSGDAESNSGLTTETLTITEEEGERLEAEAENRESGRLKSYEGDQLRYDMERMAGELVETRKRYSKTYIVEESLEEVSDVPIIGEGIDLYEEPVITTNAVTSIRFRVSPGDVYESWRARVWMKGNKVINVPYWTNTSKKFTPGKWRLKNVRYSSNTDWRIGTSVRYKEAKSKQGFFDLTYSADGDSRYEASLRQAFKFNRQMSGNVSLSNLFGGSRGYALSLSRFSGTGRSSSMGLNYNGGGQIGARYNGFTKWDKTKVNGYVNLSRYRAGDLSSLSALVNFNRDARYLDKERKFRYQLSSHARLDNNKYYDSKGSAFVAISAFRSGINLTNKTKLNLSAGTGLGITTEGTARNNLDFAVRSSTRLGSGPLVSVGYVYGNRHSSGTVNSEQTLSFALSKSRQGKWNTNFSTAYDIRDRKARSFSSGVDYVFNTKLRIWTNLTYDLRDGNFSSKSFSSIYKLYDTNINFRWFVENNDFTLDFNTKFN